MGCSHSKRKRSRRDEGGAYSSSDLEILKEVLSANESSERVELLKRHADKEVCSLVLSILDKVRTETTADLNILHESNSKSAIEEHERHVEELQTKHDQDKTKFQADEQILKAKVEQLTAELQVFKELKKRAEDSDLKENFLRNIKEHGSPGPFWETEQESLLIVIEIKAERVREQSTKLQQMDELVEKNLMLENRIVQVLQQNEELKVWTDNCQTLIQQLSKEQKDLKVELERLVEENQTLSQEKHQGST